MKKLLIILMFIPFTVNAQTELEGNYIKPVPTGGVPPYIYNLDNGPYQTNDTIIVTTPGAHTISIKDALGCVKYISFTMYGPLSISLVVKTSTSLTVAASGGKPPYSYSKNSTTRYYLDRTLWTGLTRNVTYVMRVMDALGYISSITIRL